MMYDMRTSTLRPGTVEEFEARFAQRHPYREKHAQLGAFWHTRSCTSSLRVIPAAQKPVKMPPSTICVRGQGHSVFEFNTDESQCLCRLGSQPAASRRSVGFARPP
jgi:hypothetical protein